MPHSIPKYVGKGKADVERLILGQEISELERRVFPRTCYNRTGLPSGSMGFLDFYEDSVFVEGYFVLERALKLSTLGIEPEYQGKGYGSLFLSEVESLAKKRGVPLLVAVGAPKPGGVPNIPRDKLLLKNGFEERRVNCTGLACRYMKRV